MRCFLKYIVIIFVIYPLYVKSEVCVPKFFADGMVIQREEAVKVWGWADPGEKVEVTFKGKRYRANAAGDGNWFVMLKPSKAGGPYTLEISGSNRLTINDVLIGDVWLCAGQSNMVHFFQRYRDVYPDAIAESTNDQIRQFLVPTSTNLVEPQKDLNGGTWLKANPDNLMRFSVVAYFLAKELYDEYHVPIGIINASVGGTPIEAWTSETGLKSFADIQSTILYNKDTAAVKAKNELAAAARKVWSERPLADKGLLGADKWFDPKYDPVNWQTINVPGYWEDQGIKNLDGVVWYRREIEVPKSMCGVDAVLKMGRIVDADEVYVNGEKVGNITYQYPPRNYTVPANLLKPGKNLIVVRVTNHGGKGGFVPDKPYYLEASGERIDLKGCWQYKVGEVFEKPKFPASISFQNQPTALFNAMVAPYVGYALKGVCWYQGESNTHNASQYGKLLSAFVNDWRAQWQLADLPFIVVQLPKYLSVNYLPEESNWATLRQAQLDVLNLENTGIVVTLDLGEWNDVHPVQKRPVGERVALVARHLAYGDSLTCTGPIIKSASWDGEDVKLVFDQVGSGLISGNGEPLAHFALAGSNMEFEWVNARIDEDKVVLSGYKGDAPILVRYGWADNPNFANLYNREGLPAAPFEIKIKRMKK